MGQHYYFNKKTEATIWEAPSFYVPLPSSGQNQLSKPVEDQPPPQISKLFEVGVLTDIALPPEKRKRDTVADVSYRPPISGSAADASVMTTRTLSMPIIVASLTSTSESMWTRTDIQVNQYLASVYVAGSVVDTHGQVQKFKDTTNPIQGRHLYNLVFENKYVSTLEVGLAMGASACWIAQAHANNGLHTFR